MGTVEAEICQRNRELSATVKVFGCVYHSHVQLERLSFYSSLYSIVLVSLYFPNTGRKGNTDRFEHGIR